MAAVATTTNLIWDVQESVHPRVDARVVVSDRVVKPGRGLEGHGGITGGDDGLRHRRRGREGRRLEAPRPDLQSCGESPVPRDADALDDAPEHIRTGPAGLEVARRAGEPGALDPREGLVDPSRDRRRVPVGDQRLGQPDLETACARWSEALARRDEPRARRVLDRVRAHAAEVAHNRRIYSHLPPDRDLHRYWCTGRRECRIRP